MTRAEKDRLDAVSSLSCAVCGSFCVEIHHVRRYGEKRDHFKTAALCYTHHRGPEGIHHLGKKLWERLFMTQEALLEHTERRLSQ